MPYTQFWHHYVARHAADGGSRVTVDPAAAVVVVICVALLLGWALRQATDRCDTCQHWPVRCRCGRHAER
jgi:hypothetical protein